MEQILELRLKYFNVIKKLLEFELAKFTDATLSATYDTNDISIIASLHANSIVEEMTKEKNFKLIGSLNNIKKGLKHFEQLQNNNII